MTADRDTQPIATGPADGLGRHARRRRVFEQCRQLFLFRGENDPRRGLAKQRRGAIDEIETRPDDGVDGNLGADAARVEAAFGQRHRQATVGAIVGRPDQPLVGELHQQSLQRSLGLQIDRRRHATHQPVRHLQVFAAAQFAAIGAQGHDHVARRLKAPTNDMVGVLEQTHDANDRRRINRLTIRLVVEADVAAGDRHGERAAGGADAFNRPGELPHDLRPLRVAEIQAVGGAERPAAGAGDVARRFSDRQDGAPIGVEVAVAAVAIDRHRQCALRALDSDDAGTHARHVDRVRPHHVIVLPIDPALAGNGRRPEERQQRLVRRRRRGQCADIELPRAGQVRGFRHRTVIHRRLVGQRAIRNLGDDGAAISYPQQTIAGDFADVHGVQIPFVEDPLDLRLPASLDHQQHALLRFGEHDFVRGHAALALRHERHVDLDARAAARSHFGRRAGQTRRTHVLNADERVGLHHFQAGLEQQLFHERIADLDGRPLLGRMLVEFRRRHGRAVDPVAAGLGADVVDAVADARGDALDDVRRLGDAEAEHVDEWIACVGGLERDFAAHRRNADAVAVARDAGDDALHETRRAGSVEGAESQGIEERNRPRPHREDIADDPADAGCGPLIRLDERRVIVRLDLEDRREPLADVDRAGVLAGALQHLRPLRRQRLEVHA